MSEQKIPIPAMLYNVAVGGHVTNSQQIIDENLNREQNDINQETVGAVPYNSTTPNGMGRIVLKKTDNFKTIVEAQTGGNTIFVIKYDFTLTGNVTIPANCVLRFDGGSISNGTLVGQNTIIDAGRVKIFNDTITIAGTWKNKIVYEDWFDDIDKIEELLLLGVYIVFGKNKTYTLTRTVALKSNHVLDFNGSTVKLGTLHYREDTIFFENRGVFTLREISNVSIKNVKIVLDRNTELMAATRIFYFYVASEIYLTNITIDGHDFNKIGYCPIDFYSNNSYITILNSYFYHVSESETENFTGGIWIREVFDGLTHNINIKNSSFYKRGGTDEILAVFAVLGNVENIQIANSEFNAVAPTDVNHKISHFITVGNAYDHSSDGIYNKNVEFLNCFFKVNDNCDVIYCTNNNCQNCCITDSMILIQKEDYNYFVASISYLENHMKFNNTVVYDKAPNSSYPLKFGGAISGLNIVCDYVYFDYALIRNCHIECKTFFSNYSSSFTDTYFSISEQTESVNINNVQNPLIITGCKFVVPTDGKELKFSPTGLSMRECFSNAKIAIMSNGACSFYGCTFYDFNKNAYSNITFRGNLIYSKITVGATVDRPKFGSHLDTNYPFRGFQYFDTDLDKPIFADTVNNTTVRWVDERGYTAANNKGTTAQRPTSILTTLDFGYQYFDTDLGKPIFLKVENTGTPESPVWVKYWVDATGATV